jgi:hypothetical protein
MVTRRVKVGHGVQIIATVRMRTPALSTVRYIDI